MAEKKTETNAEEKRIEVVTKKVRELGTGFGNPRKIAPKKLEELKKSLQMLGDFGIFIIDENDDLIAGNQRASVLMEIDPDTEVTCKKLIGYSIAEKRTINIKDNTHSGDWDVDLLADWTSDIIVDLGLDDIKMLDPDEREIKDMELIRYEKYDYVVIACRYETDYNELCRNLGIEGKKVKICKSRKIKARAIWYEDMKAQIVPKEDVEDDEGSEDGDEE